MTRINPSTESLLSQINEDQKREILTTLVPSIRKLETAIHEIESILKSPSGAPAGAAAPAADAPPAARRGRKPGRPKGTKKKAGRPPGVKPGDEKPARRKPGRKPGRPAGAKSARKGAAKSGRMPRGALRDAVADVMKGGGAMKLTAVRDALLAKPAFTGREPKGLYVQIVRTVQGMPQVRKSGSGYQYKGK